MKEFFAVALLCFAFASCTNYDNDVAVNQIIKQPAFIDSAALFLFHAMQVDSIKKSFKETDIIFRAGTDIESETIREFSETDKLFSHCGILVYQDSNLVVAHMLGGITNPNGGIVFDSIEKFLSYPDNKGCGLYSLKINTGEKNKLYQFIDSVKKNNIGFDLKFDLFDKTDLYCTEFLVDAIEFAKNDTTTFFPTKYALKNTKYFFLANKGTDFYFYPIDAFQNSSSLKLKRLFHF